MMAVSCLKEEEKFVFDPSDPTQTEPPKVVSYEMNDEGLFVTYTPAVFNVNSKVATHALVMVKMDGASTNVALTGKDNKESHILSVSKSTLTKALTAAGAEEGATVAFDVVVRATMPTVEFSIDSEQAVSTSLEIIVNKNPWEAYTEVSAWGVTGSIESVGFNWDKDITMYTDGGRHVARAVKLTPNDQFKFRKDHAWGENFGAEGDVEPFVCELGTEYPASAGGKNLGVAAEGVYDLLLDTDAGTFTILDAYITYPGFDDPSDWGVTGAIESVGLNWDNDVTMTTNGTWHVAEGVVLSPFDQFKFRKDHAWGENFGAEGDVEPFECELDVEYPAAAGGKNLCVKVDGTYDLLVNPDAKLFKIVESLGGKSPVSGGDDPGPGPEPEPVTGWNIIGLNGDWDNDVLATEKDGVWTAFITAVPAEGAETTEFKWRKDGDWSAGDYGMSKDEGYTYTFGTAFPAVASGANIPIAAGFYKVELNLTDESNPTITVYDDFTIWSLIGVNGDWDNDIDMAEADGKWVSPATAISGEFKLRKNHDWGVNRGGTFAELGVAFDVVHDGSNINVPEGEYIVTYDPATETVVVDAALPSNTWSLIGVNGDWNNDIFMTELMPGIWVSPKVDITSAGWKVRFNHDWAVNRGATITAEGVFAEAIQNGDNINLTGNFQVVYNANNETIGTLVWGLVGSIASIDGFSWNHDVPMNLGADGKWYSIPVVLAEGDEIKIRKYADWAENFGGDFAEADVPFAAVAGGNNIKAAGKYMVVYDPEAVTITLSTNFWGLIGDFNSWGGDKFMMFDGANWVAYNQNLSGGWKIRKTADWADNRGGVFAEPDAFFTAAPGGDNINVGNMADFDVVYLPDNELIYIGNAAEMPTPDPGVPSITIDGKTSDWTGEGIVSFTCKADAELTGMKSVKALYSDKLYFLFEFSDEALATGVTDGKLRLHIFFGEDNFAGLARYWEPADIKYMLEGKATSGGSYCTFSAKYYMHSGDTPTSWTWTSQDVSPTCVCAGEGNFYEMSLDYSNYPGALGNTITLGFDCADGNYNVIGYLPNDQEAKATLTKVQ